jgi:class 3 adenylate cyclase
MPVCPGCSKETQAEWRFCRNCGQVLASEVPPAPVTVDEFVASEVIARRIPSNELPGLLNKSLEIQEGQSALLFLNGRHDTTLPPGKHSLGNVFTGRGGDASVVLFRTADVAINLSLTGLLTADPLPLTVDLRLTVKIDQPLFLWTNLAAGADAYTDANLTGSLYPLAEEGCEIFFRSRPIRHLEQGGAIGEELQLALASHMDQQLSRWGVRLVSVKGVNVGCEAWDEITQSRTQYFVTASEEWTDLEGRKRLFDVRQESELQTMAQETAEVAGVEKRVSLWARMRQAIQSNARNEIHSQGEMENLMRQADKDGLLKNSERDDLMRSLSDAGDDHRKARDFALRRVESEGEFELQKLDLWHRFGLEQERLTFETTAARDEMESRREMDLRRLDLDIEKDRRYAAFRREQEAADQQAADAAVLGGANTASTVAGLELAEDDALVRAALGWRAQYQSQKRDDEREKQRTLLEAEERRLAMDLDAETQRLELRLRERRDQHGQELERIQTLSGVSIETLIAVSGSEQSQLLAQLARTRSLAGCTTQQILAMQAAENPQVAGALKELLTTTAASGQLEQYERLVTQLKDSATTSREDYQQNMVVMQQMFDKALDTMKDTAVAFSGASVPGPAQQPDLQAQTGPDGTITVFFSDIEGSTAITDRLGDERAQELLHTHNDIIRRILRAHNGFEVKSMGDGFMLAFAEAGNGVQCSIDIQRALAAYNAEHPDEPLKVRIGLHTGEAIHESQDYFGRNVILASRISSKAKGGEILVSSLVKELTQSSGGIRFGDGREVELKGLSGLTQVHLVEWS